MIPSTMPVSSLREIRRAFDTETFDKLQSNPEFLRLFLLYGPMEEIAPTLTNFDSVKWFFLPMTTPTLPTTYRST